ncbi:peptide chain release factor N(5)-glutamine methyltransferase [Aurantibacter sp.]|uniref:peptide chain release factor N(5)-glutamine methyltransferase n=1 Tax=Aurantibacter sp. TaxID=2807103 RepID=UPI0035C81CDC
MKLKDIEYLFHKELDTLFGKDEVNQFFYLCIESFYNLSRLDLALDTNMSITVDEQSKIIEALEQLKQEIPIQYILGKTEFFGLPFNVTEATLIPRPETEELVSLILTNVTSSEVEKLSRTKKPITILDIGTGSGCIAISLAKNLPNATVYALDVSAEALKIAKSNAELNKVDVTFIEQSILEDFNLETKFDVIVSNPPYVRELEKAEIKPNVLNNEPHLALFVADNNPLLFYKAITEFAEKQLTKKGQLYFEINEYLREEMKSLVSSYKFEDIEIVKDMFEKDRMLKAELRH